MRQYSSKTKNTLHFIYRMVRPIIDPIKTYQGITGYFWYFNDMRKHNALSKKKIGFDTNLFPVLDEKVTLTPFDAHYFYQQLWAFEHVLKKKPTMHVDVASTYQFSGYLSKIVKTTFVDIRPIKTSLKNLDIEKGDILKMPYKNNTIPSLSCLHVAEHIGLGRYGDPIDPKGTEKACRELSRILAPGGDLYFSTPIGKERICFNAHRIHPPEIIMKYFGSLKLISFSVVDDKGLFHENTAQDEYTDSAYACGMFHFTK